MTVLAWLLCSCTVAVPRALASSSDAASNLLVDADAESSGLAAWQAEGFSVATYGSSASVPSASFAAAHELGDALFVGERTGASMSQTVALEDFAHSIDAGAQEFEFGGWLGGSAPGSDGVQASVQFLAADRQPVDGAVEIGPPTVGDREGATTMLECRVVARAPAGARFAQFELLATGANETGPVGMGGALYFAPVTPPVAVTEAAAAQESAEEEVVQVSWGWVTHAVEGPGCTRMVYEPIVSHVRRAVQPPDIPISPPPPSPSPQAMPPRASHVKLTRKHVSLQLSAAAVVHMVLYRAILATGAHSGRALWRLQKQLTLHASAAGTVTSTFRRSLRPGRYRVGIEAVSMDGKDTTLSSVWSLK
ncbi:MAG TPA: hypothetical protein VMF09_14485 [Solirubrobacteraceae bacterium]|nr:hypothetical protein [Solirubrobacteraceae bacterium]